MKSNNMENIEDLAKQYREQIVPNPSAFDAPYYTTGELADDLQEAFIAGYQKAIETHKWISVEDRLPKVGLILVFQNFEIYVIFYDGLKQIAFSHWMPLPESP